MSPQNKSDGIVIKKFDPLMEDQVVEFLMEDFLRDEPLCKPVQMKPSPGIAKIMRDALKMDASFVALDTNADNKLVGVRLSGISRRDQLHERSEDHSTGDEDMDKIVKLLNDAFDQLDLFNKYNVDVILLGKMLSVHKDYRGRGIAGRMMEATMDFMRENKIPLCYIPCTSAFTVKVLKKLDFEIVLEIPYVKYLIDGKRVFYPEEPHNAFTACIKLV